MEKQASNSGSSSTVSDAVSMVSLKLPPPWTGDIESWFQQVEAQFTIRGITNETTRFYHVVAVLNSDVAARVSNTLRNPPAATPYTALKQALLAKYGLTDYERAVAINAITNLGDRKPSEMMDHMLYLLGNNEGGLMFRFHFFKILPDYVRATLSYSTATDMATLAAEADRIFLSGRPQQPAIHSATKADTLVDRISNSARKLCFYHSRFGPKATKCQQPCAWRPGNAKSDQQQ
jgi:hypothetical protein